MALEHEIKVPVASLDVVRSRLRELGGSLQAAAMLEDNWVLDDAGRRLGTSGCLLRVRRWGTTASVTFKGPARFSGGVKTRQEIETGVGDADIVLDLFAALGLTSWRRYQKRREAWRLAGVAVALDDTPMGGFVELEGEPAMIPGAAAQLGLDMAAAVPGTYLHLWEAFRATHPGAPVDMVFS
jgi:adenylate cyclase, class 2